MCSTYTPGPKEEMGKEMTCDMCQHRTSGKKPNEHTKENNMCYECWIWLE